MLAELGHDFGFVWSVAGSFAANGSNVTGVNAAREATDMLFNSFFSETVPVASYEVCNLIAVLWRARSPPDIAIELGLMKGWIKCDYICTWRKRIDGVADGVTIIFED
jgi:hypothetical protein